MAEKIERDAFLYLEPIPGQENDFAQCGPCRLFVPQEKLGDKFKSGRCIAHGSFVEVDEDDSCGFMLPWPTSDGEPVAQVVEDHANELKKMITGSVTAIDSGLVSRRVQCHRCRFPTDDEVSRCGLYEDLNKKFPDAFALDPNIKRHACCNAQTPKEKPVKTASGRTFADLPAEAKAAFKRFQKVMPQYTEAQYLKHYKWK